MLLIIMAENDSVWGPQIGAVAQVDTHDEAVEKGTKMAVQKLTEFRSEEVSDKEKEAIKKEFEVDNCYSPEAGDYHGRCWSISIATVDTL